MFKKKNYFQRRIIGRMPIFCFLGLLFFIGLTIGIYYAPQQSSTLPLSVIIKSQLLYGGALQDIDGYRQSLPVFAEVDAATASSLQRWEVTSYRDRRTDTQIPVFYGETATANGERMAVGTALIRENEVKDVAVEAIAPAKTSVLIYCTHTAESYDGTKDEEGRGEVLQVAHSLANTLTEVYHIGAVVSDTVHDAPDWYRSYTNSKATAGALLEQYPEADLLIDLHRDSGVTKASSTVTVAGKDAARLLLVVGSDAKLSHPHWQNNWATAKAIGASIDKVDPSLLKGIRVQKGRYNQHLSEKAILLEVGTELNTLAEAKYSAALTAEAISNYLAEKAGR